MWSRLLYRKNNVPKWQRIHQTHDGLRIWQKGPYARYFLPPYYVMLWGGFAGSIWMVGRMALGHRTWWGKG